MSIRFLNLVFCSFLLGGLLFCGVSCKDDGDTPKNASPVNSASVQSENASPVVPASESILVLNYEGTLDLGKVYQTQKKEGAFTVTNVSSIPQEICTVSPTCECITLDKDYNETVLKPGESLEIKFVMDALTVKMKSFRRFIQITTHSGFTVKAAVGGWIVKLADVEPGRVADLGFMKDPAQSWTQVFEIHGNPELPEELTLGEIAEHPFFNCHLVDKGNGDYTLTVTPKVALPYARSFGKMIDIPVLNPAEAEHLPFYIKAQVGEAVNFAPDEWKIVREKLEASGSFTEAFAYGEVPGLLEEKKDASKDSKNMMSVSLLRQHNAVPLKFVKEHHDWDDLFANLEYEAPRGVKLEKIRHPQGIELKITVTKEAFTETDNVQVVPFRGPNRCAPITIKLLD